MNGKLPERRTRVLEQLSGLGKDQTPTTTDIIEGRVGNGTWERNAQHLETIRTQHIERQREQKADFRKAFASRVEESLLDTADFNVKILEIADRLLMKIEQGLKLTTDERNILKMAQKSAKELTDRAIGTPKSVSEVTQTTSFLGVLLNGDLVPNDEH
jgi:hypothetical protein